MMRTYLKNSLTKLEMDDPIELNRQVIQEEALQREEEEQALAADKEENEQSGNL